jgi:hypothetical protein
VSGMERVSDETYSTFDKAGNLVPVPRDIADAIDAIIDDIFRNKLDYSTEQIVARAVIEDRARRTPPSLAGGVEGEEWPDGPKELLGRVLSTVHQITAYHITNPPTADHVAVKVCNGDLRELDERFTAYCLATSALTPSPVPTTIPAETSGREGALEEAADGYPVHEDGINLARMLGSVIDDGYENLDRINVVGPHGLLVSVRVGSIRAAIRALTAVSEEGNRGTVKPWLIEHPESETLFIALGDEGKSLAEGGGDGMSIDRTNDPVAWRLYVEQQIVTPLSLQEMKLRATTGNSEMQEILDRQLSDTSRRLTPAAPARTGKD